MSWDCDAGSTLCSNNKCCQSGVCCGDTCCAGGSSCCGNICCDASTFCCESNFCCLGCRDACAILVGLGPENSTISAVCTNTAESLAGSTITIPVLIGSSSTRIGNTTGGFVTSSSSSSTLSSSRPPLVTDPSHGKAGSKNSGSKNSGSGTISSSAIAGIVVAGIAALSLLVAAIWLCRRHKKSNYSRGLERHHQPTDGGHESPLEKADIQKHSSETQASEEVYELEVPPHEIGDGPLSPIRELPLVEKPAELDGSETMTSRIQVTREEDPGSGHGSAGGWF